MAILYGVGVGPGDFEQITLKAYRIIESCDVVFVPAKDYKKSVAFNIVSKAIPSLENKKVIGLDMPMTKDKEEMKNAHEKAAEEIRKEMNNCSTAVFLTLGDVTIYSTFYYISEILNGKGIETGLVNGIPSFLAAASLINSRLVIGNEQLHIFSAIDMGRVNEAIELPGTKVFMKVGSKMNVIKKMLMENKKKAYFIENCGMENERAVEGACNFPDGSGYYSMVIVFE